MIDLIGRLRSLTHRLTAPEPLMDDIQRDVELDTMSPDDFGDIVAFFAAKYPAYFDAGVAALGSYQHEAEVA